MTPISRGFGGRRRASDSLAARGLFIGQSQEFFAAVKPLAQTADAAQRESWDSDFLANPIHHRQRKPHD